MTRPRPGRMRAEHKRWLLAEVDRVEREAAAGRMVLLEQDRLVLPSTGQAWAAAAREMARTPDIDRQKGRVLDRMVVALFVLAVVVLAALPLYAYLRAVEVERSYYAGPTLPLEVVRALDAAGCYSARGCGR